MTAIADSAAHLRAANRLLASDRSIRGAFDGLALGWDYDDAEEYLMGTPLYDELPPHLRGRTVGALLAFAVVCVERDREKPGGLAARG